MRGLLVVLALLGAGAAAAETRPYRVAPPGEKQSRAEAFLVYSLGTHTTTANEIQGTLRLEASSLDAAEGSIVVPIASLRGDGGTRDCHMREALGLDYSRSRFPSEHVCDGENRLPATGPEAIAFPEIRLELLSARPLDDLGLLATGKPVRVEIETRWTVHGVTKPARELVRVLRDGDGLRVRGRSTLVLKDFGVVVKSTKVLFAEVTVGDAVTVTYDLKLLPDGS
jgi:polyisoprenoid-binding protein YceI